MAVTPSAPPRVPPAAPAASYPAPPSPDPALAPFFNGLPSYRNFRVLVAGWLHGFGRRTITAWPWRPRERGNCVPAPQTLAATWRRWRLLPVTLYGQAVTPQIFALTALW
jgi:hypothetical protein